MRCERIALPTEPYPHGRFTNSIIINTQKKCKHNYINRFTNFNCYGKIFFTWRHGSAGRAFASHARGHRFESCCLHQWEPRSHPWFLFICVKGVAGIIVKTKVAEKKISYDWLTKPRQNGKFVKKTK